MSCTNPHCRKHVITRYIRRKGKIVYPKRAAFFSFCIEDKEKATRLQNKVA